MMEMKNIGGLTISLLGNGAVRSIEAGPVRINLRAVSAFSRPGTNIYLRIIDGQGGYSALLGPESSSRSGFSAGSFIAAGNWKGIDYRCVLQLREDTTDWQWQTEITNRNEKAIRLDLICVQDIGLKQKTDGLINEYYVSQYLERRILESENHGKVICCRQNMKEPTGNPWLLMACRTKGIAASTDGIQFYGCSYRETGVPEGLVRDFLDGEYAGESSVVALQEEPFVLAPGETHSGAFVFSYLPDHPDATSPEDLQRLPALMSGFTALPVRDDPVLQYPERNLFSLAQFLPVSDLDDLELRTLFPGEWRHTEKDNGKVLSFFHGQHNHVMLRLKELLTDRPHAHIMQANTGFAPDERIVSTTTFAFGVFNSHLTQGNTNFNTLLSVCSSQFNLSTETGQRIFLETGGRWLLLGIPSAFEMGLNQSRWIYKTGNSLLQLRTWTSMSSPRVSMDFKVLKGSPVNLIVTHHFDGLNGWTVHRVDEKGDFTVSPEAQSMICSEYPGAQFRIRVNGWDDRFTTGGNEMVLAGKEPAEDRLFVLNIKQTSSFSLDFIGEVCGRSPSLPNESPDRIFIDDDRDARDFREKMSLKLTLDGEHPDIAAIREILPWYTSNALIHFLTPYGLEQFSGAAWGTRDIAQGPFDLLLAMEKYDQARQVLMIIFSNQHPDGGWPQWWMFDRYSRIRADSAHGDIYYWCILALCSYIKVTGDHGILDVMLPYFTGGHKIPEKRTTLEEHVERLVGMITASFIPGTSLVPFGGGDWNDSLQPVSKELAQRMISSWTVEMNYQAFDQLGQVWQQCGKTEKGEELLVTCDNIRRDFNDYLIKDGLVAGYGLVENDKSISLLLHPDDRITGIRYSILPMNRGIISGIFSKEQARCHQEVIEEYLKGPDGARLMDRPLKYRGGIQTIFQRAESSTFFGREIGLMYTHEHIRYAEALAITGKADAFVKALRQGNPVAYREVVKCGDFRQSNCYYSSSDVSFRSRYEADDKYDEIKTGTILLKGGWRVYSSGPGIYVGLIMNRLLGLRLETGSVIFDPVIPFSMDGLTASIQIKGHPVLLRYQVRKRSFGPESISVNGRHISFIRGENKYREGGAVIPTDRFLKMLDQANNTVDILL